MFANCRADQGVLSREDLHDISKVFHLGENIELHIVTHKGLDLTVPEHSLCLYIRILWKHRACT